jgi:hypothetical protein
MNLIFSAVERHVERYVNYFGNVFFGDFNGQEQAIVAQEFTHIHRCSMMTMMIPNVPLPQQLQQRQRRQAQRPIVPYRVIHMHVHIICHRR